MLLKGHWEANKDTGCIARLVYGTKGNQKSENEYRCFLNAELDDGTPLTVPYVITTFNYRSCKNV